MDYEAWEKGEQLRRQRPTTSTYHAHGVGEVALDLIEDVLGGAAQQDGHGLGVLALDQVRPVLVADLGDLEQTAPCTATGTHAA